jgi:hypothetical protein
MQVDKQNIVQHIFIRRLACSAAQSLIAVTNYKSVRNCRQYYYQAYKSIKRPHPDCSAIGMILFKNGNPNLFYIRQSTIKN